MSYVTRTNPSIAGLGCPNCGGEADCFMSPAYGTAAYNSDRDQPGLPYGAGPMGNGMRGLGLGMDTYATASWFPPSQSSYGAQFGSIAQSGSAANTLAQTSPDAPNPTTQAVFDAFSNNNGGPQPGVLALYPNATADGLTFVRPPQVSTQCKIVNAMGTNPLLFIGGAFALVYLLNSGAHSYREHRARKRAAAK